MGELQSDNKWYLISCFVGGDCSSDGLGYEGLEMVEGEKGDR